MKAEKRLSCKALSLKQETDDTVIHTFLVAHDAIDKEMEVIPVDVLNSLAEQLPGKGIYKNHDTWELPEGKIVKALTDKIAIEQFKALTKVDPLLRQNQDSINVLYADGEFAKDTDIAKKLKSKIIGNVSIGFYYQNKPIDKGTYMLHQLPVQADEFSIVNRSIQPGAQIIKSKEVPEHKFYQGDNMEDLGKVQKELTETKVELAKKETDLQAALSEVKTLKQEKESNDPLVQMGKKYQESVDKELVELKVKTGDLKEEDRPGFEKLVKGLPLDYKLSEIKSLKTRLEAKYQTGLKVGQPGYQNPLIEEVD